MRRILHFFHGSARGAASRWRNLWFRLLGVRIDGYVWMRRISIPRLWADIHIERGAALDDGVVLFCSGPPKAEKIFIREGTYINRGTIIDASEHIEIGKNCMIGPRCFLTDGDHGFDSTDLIRCQSMRIAPVVIEDNVWIGAGAVILKGVRVATGAVVGAGAVVTKNVPKDTIVAGVPAKRVSERGV